jgi:hypothetical protein
MEGKGGCRGGKMEKESQESGKHRVGKEEKSE